MYFILRTTAQSHHYLNYNNNASFPRCLLIESEWRYHYNLNYEKYNIVSLNIGKLSCQTFYYDALSIPLQESPIVIKRINSGKWGWRVQVENNLSGGPQLKQQWDPDTLCGRHGAPHHLTIQTVRMRDPHSILYHNLLGSNQKNIQINNFTLHSIKLSIKSYKLKKIWFYDTIFLPKCYFNQPKYIRGVFFISFTFKHF